MVLVKLWISRLWTAPPRYRTSSASGSSVRRPLAGVLMLGSHLTFRQEPSRAMSPTRNPQAPTKFGLAVCGCFSAGFFLRSALSVFKQMFFS